jgi:4-amino-4-deoxy-L-arabinose transferase-like glycosyltransferase
LSEQSGRRTEDQAVGTTNSTHAWRGAGPLVAALTGVLVVYPLVIAPSIPLLDPDEGLHASIAQEMVERGDWIVPRFQGEPFLDKPILYFWAEAASLRAFGMCEAAVRLPGLVFGLLGALTTALLAARMFNRPTGLLAGLLYATMILPVALAQAAAHDVALVPWVNLALLCFWEADQPVGHVLQSGDRPPRARLTSLACTVAAGLVLGLAILTKGLVGVALVGIGYGGYLVATRRLTLAACLRGTAALGIAAAVASAWYFAVEARIPGYLHYYFVDRHLLGFTTDTQRHGGTRWWYYLPILLGGGLPWIAYVPVVLQDGWAKWRDGTRHNGIRTSHIDTSRPAPRSLLSTPRAPLAAPQVLLWCWLIGSVLFLSVSHSKLVTYLWPVFPAVAILGAVAWGRLIDGQLTQDARRSMAWTFWSSCLAGPLVLPCAIVVAQRAFDFRLDGVGWLVAAVVSAGAWAPIWFWRQGSYRATLAAATLSTAAQFAFLMAAVMPHVAAEFSARDLARHVNQQGQVPPRLLLVEERIGSLVFYLNPKLRAELQCGQLQALKFDQAEPLPAPGPGQVLAISERQVRRADRYFHLESVPYQRAGRHRLYRFAEVAARQCAPTEGGAAWR